jgi:hypothetical protein
MHRKGLLAAGVDLDLSVSTLARRLENPEVGGGGVREVLSQ